MLTDTGLSVTIATPGIIRGLHHGKASGPYILKAALREILSVFKEAGAADCQGAHNELGCSSQSSQMNRT
jgi:hypothetical protein